jgi:hypothetical protein
MEAGPAVGSPHHRAGGRRPPPGDRRSAGWTSMDGNQSAAGGPQKATARRVQPFWQMESS